MIANAVESTDDHIVPDTIDVGHVFDRSVFLNWASDDNFKQYRCRFTMEDINQEVHDLVDYYGVYFAKGSAMPFVPLTHDSQKEWPEKITGVRITLNAFKKICEQSHEALFQEMKLRTFLSMGCKDLIRELHKILMDNDHNLTVVCEHAMAFTDTLTKANDTIATLRAAGDNTDEDRGAPVRSTTRQAEEQQLTDPINNQWSNVIQEKDEMIQILQSKVINITGREGTPDSTRSGRGPCLTPKQKDPLIFINNPLIEKDKPAVKFNHWFLILRKKLTSSADHFPTDNDKVMYILTHLGGTALSRLMPFVNPDDVTKEFILKTSKEILDHLHEQYNDLNKQNKVKKKFNKLEMTTSMDFKDFQLEFVRLAGMAKKEKSTWKEELFKRLPSRLNTICLDKYHNEANDTPQGQPQNTNPPKDNSGGGNSYPPHNQTPNPTPRGFPNRRPASGTVEHYNLPVLSTASDGCKIYKKPQLEQIKALITKGQCFIRHEHGHWSSGCPVKSDFEKQNKACINAISAKLFDPATEDSTAAALATAEGKV
ncbi:Uu.00g030850.m01.CDS01 [Anthostomella pinea]|uniref:Uu.00g030850.m01.CDS01 n=1 Tax=Anthostomella pinea TaxID=933095 RepID=A0AAI8V8Z4_9PEZI|nr:Uu.00g030850.m01.CDS01 [Anthostomella pinea]